jgi:Protein of unknown function (DUF2786)
MTTETAAHRAKMLERVRALLAKADSTNFPEEANTFRAKADALMTQYAIDQWQVDAATGAANARPEPEVRQVDFSWWSNGHSLRDHLWDLLWDVAAHCRCVVATRGYGSGHGGSYSTMPVIGLPSDLDYMDMLFTHLMLQMQKEMAPQPNPTQTLGENALRMRQAGMGMREGKDSMAPLLWRAGMLPLTDQQQDKYRHVAPEDHWRTLPSSLQKSLVGRVRRAINDEAKRTGQPVPTHVHPRVWHRSFGAGFVGEVRKRFAEMRRAQEAPTGGSTGSMALAIVDIRQQAINLYDELWPRPETVATKGRSRALPTREVAFSGEAYTSGRQAGARADIHANPSKRVGNPTPGLPGGQA